METLPQPRLEDIRLEDVLSALGDPTRLEIVRKLVREGELSCKCLCGETPKSTLSHHFRVLREAGVTQTRICGTQRWVSVREEDLEQRFPGLLGLVRQEAETPALSAL